MQYLILILFCLAQCCFCNAAERRSGIFPSNTRERGYTAENLFITPDCSTVCSSPNSEKPKDRSLVYEYPVPIKDMWVNGATIASGKIYVRQKYCILFNNGKWVEFPDLCVHGIKNDPIFYKSLTITDVKRVDEKIYETPYECKYNFKVSYIKVTITNHSEQDIMLLNHLYFEHYKEWQINDNNKVTGLLRSQYYNIYIPANGSTDLYLKILPTYNHPFAYERKGPNLHQPKKILDYRFQKGRNIHLQLVFLTCFYGEEYMRCSSVPFILRYKGKLN